MVTSGEHSAVGDGHRGAARLGDGAHTCTQTLSLFGFLNSCSKTGSYFLDAVYKVQTVQNYFGSNVSDPAMPLLSLP